MIKILCYIATHEGKIRRASLEVLSYARSEAKRLGTTVDALLIDPDPDAFIEAVSAYGPARIFAVRHAVFGRHLNSPVLSALEAGIRASGAGVVAMASTESVKDVLGALAVRLEAAALPDVSTFTVVADGVEVVRPVMAAKQQARARASADLTLVSVRSGSFDASESPGESQVVPVPFEWNDDSLVAVLREVVKASGAAVDLSEARVVVAAGRGVKDEEGRALVNELAELFGGAIGASRAVVESGLFPATAQIGQTGKVVSPDLYFALGISGAIQHVAGMANSRVIVAINKDPDAPIFKYATYGIAADLYKVLPPLIAALREARARA